MPTCSTCRWAEEFYPPMDGEPGAFLCRFPVERLPLSMAGVANRERETVLSDATGCPTHEERPCH